MRNNPTLIIVVVLAAFLFGLVTGRSIPAGDRPIRGGDQSLIAPQIRGGEQDGAAPQRVFQTPRADDAPRPRTDEDGFRFDRLSLDLENEAPRACLQFTQELKTDGSVNYGDFIRVEPKAQPAVSAAGSSLCLTGLAFDKDYRVQLRPGLPSADGEELARGERVTVAFGDKPPFIGFAGDGVVLPRLEADGLGITTVNVEKLQVTVARVSDRSLARKSIVKGASLKANDYYYVYGDENGADVGAPVFDGQIDVEGERNQSVNTIFPLGAALKDLRPGAYFVRVRDASPGADTRRPAQAWRWVMFTDMALTTYSSDDGVDVFVRSIETARPIAGVELVLIASNNDILASSTTNTEGRARFDGPALKGAAPLDPRMIMAYGPQEDFTAIDLHRAPLDLSERDIGGRAASAKQEAYVYFDRGIYRPGETAHITGLLRDAAGAAVEDRPLTVTIRRPNNTEALRRRIEDLEIGGFSTDYEIPSSAARGQWRLIVEAEGLGEVGSARFAVEDFVPQRLEVTLDVDEKTPIRAGEVRQVKVNGRFLYGAPAGRLPIEAEARLRIDPNPFPEYKEYRFGAVDGRFQERFLRLPQRPTNPEGASTIPLRTDLAGQKVNAPLRADVVVGIVEPGGRVVRESARIPVRAQDAYVGLKLANDGDGFGQGELADIEAVLLDWQGRRQAGDLEWRLVEEDYWFDWYRQNGEWRWRRSYKDLLIAEGRATARLDATTRISEQLDTGSYRLSVVDPKSGAKSDIRFYVGWRSYAAGADTPDQAALTAPREPVQPGARARLFLTPPYDGEAIVTVATDKVHLVRRLKVERSGREIVIDTDPSWGAGFYVLASVVTPRKAADQPVPRRAMAVSYVPFDMSERTLGVSINAPTLIEPNQQFDLPMVVEGAQRGETVMMTVSAVDEGILRLTKFSSPDPVQHFYGKRRLGIDVRDDYGRILNANLGAPARFGGDQLGGEGLTVVPTKSVALYSGPVEVGANGRVSVPVNVPDFNGELRLMAVAWSNEKLGAAAQPLTVRDAVPALLSLPRFLAPGDKAIATLSIDNVAGAAGDYRVRLSASGPVALERVETIALAKGERKTLTAPLKAGDTGVADIKLEVMGPDGFSVAHDYQIQVRTPFFPVTNVSTALLAPGEQFLATKALVEPFKPGSGAVNVSFSRLRGVEPGALLDSLYRYPYGCSEQITSTATPLLFVDTLGGEVARAPDRAVRPRVQKAINTLLSRQSADGAFGLWREGDGAASPWIGAYIVDFLYRAKAEGYGVPDEALTRAYRALQQVAAVNRWAAVRYQMRAYEGRGSNDSTVQLRRRAAAYAFYVLARAGEANLSDLRYFHDALLKDTHSPLARAHIGAALALYGDNVRSANAFAKAGDAMSYNNTGNYYQTPLRDAAGVLALAVEAGRRGAVERFSEVFSRKMKKPVEMHTQEKAFVLTAAQALLRGSGPVSIAIGNEVVDDIVAPSFETPLEALDGEGLAYANRGSGPVFRTVTVSGAPKEAPAPVTNGFFIRKRIASLRGHPADLSTVKQNDKFVIILSGRSQAPRLHPAIIADLLPPGFEIESILTPADGAGRNGGSGGVYHWIGAISPTKVAEARDDRFIAALDVRDTRFTVAYVVRAVTPGEYTMPGVVIEDMYRPGVVARTEAQRLTIAAAD